MRINRTSEVLTYGTINHCFH